MAGIYLDAAQAEYIRMIGCARIVVSCQFAAVCGSVYGSRVSPQLREHMDSHGTWTERHRR